MVRAGLGLAVMPRLSLEFLDEELNTHEPVPAIAPREIYLGWKADRTLSPLARQVIDLTLAWRPEELEVAGQVQKEKGAARRWSSP